MFYMCIYIYIYTHTYIYIHTYIIIIQYTNYYNIIVYKMILFAEPSSRRSGPA